MAAAAAVRRAVVSNLSDSRFGSQNTCLRALSSGPARRFAALWGNGDYGRLGVGNLGCRWRPVVCRYFDGDAPISLSCGGAHTLFLTQSGRVYATGLNNFGQLGVTSTLGYTPEPVQVSGLPENSVQISAGYHHSSAVTSDGKLYIWGNNSSGQLGLGRKAKNIVPIPTCVDSLKGISIQMAALGMEHSIALTDEGNVLSWGAGGAGRLGHGHQSSFLGFSFSSSEYTPRLIKQFEGCKIKMIAAGMMHSACVDDQGSVFVFGQKVISKLGSSAANYASTPTVINEMPFARRIACGGYHTCVVTSEGQLYSWGSNENGCLGHSSTEVVHTPQVVDGFLTEFPISEVSCGWKHTAAISGGNVFTWGWGGANGTFFEDCHSSGGQLGHGSDLDSLEPKLLNLGNNTKALHISCGFNHTGGIFQNE